MRADLLVPRYWQPEHLSPVPRISHDQKYEFSTLILEALEMR
jgi:hypothetical protein